MSGTPFFFNRARVLRVFQPKLISAQWMRCLAGTLPLIFAIPATAQLTGKGSITGTITDSTGAVIPGATVAATNNATKITTTTTTTGAGRQLRQSRPRHLLRNHDCERLREAGAGEHPRECDGVTSI